MKRKSLLFAIVLIMAVSLAPSGGVSAQRTGPASSASESAAPVPAARTTYHKLIKTQWKVNDCYGNPVGKYIQKIYWGTTTVPSSPSPLL
jgi:hypothetical protein